jgi:hypothetical protein
MTNIIKFPTPEDTPITPEFLMEFCDDYQLETVEEFMSVFMRALDGVSIEDSEDDSEDSEDDFEEDPIGQPITEHEMVSFLMHHEIRDVADLKELSDSYMLLSVEANVPVEMIN